MSKTDYPDYFWPKNLDTGEVCLTTYFTARICRMDQAADTNLEAKISDLISDVRDEIARRGIAARPSIKEGRFRILQEDKPDENLSYGFPEAYSTVMVYLTDATPDDPRLTELLEKGFKSELLNTSVEFSIPTVQSEADLESQLLREQEEGEAFVARATSERAESVRASQLSGVSAPSFTGDVTEDDLFD